MFVGKAALIALVTQMSGASAAELGEHMKAGQQLFQSKMYKAAISEFEQVTHEQPFDATAHYYLAVSLVHAGSVAKAYPHFQQAVSLSAPNAEIHQLATTSLYSYQKSAASNDPPAPTQTSQATPPVAQSSGPLLPSKSFNGGASAELDKNAMSGGYSQSANQSTYTPNRNFSSSTFSRPSLPGRNIRNYSSGSWGVSNGNSQSTSGAPAFAISNSASTQMSPITKDMTAADQALSMIKRQSDKQVQLAATGVHMEYYDANTRGQINQINQNANAQVNNLLTPTWHGGRRGGFYSSASQWQIDNINNQARFRIANLRSETDKAEGARQVQQATTEAASNLSDQIRNQKLTGSGVLLRAEGTNLNVRNYETFHSDQDDRDAILPMLAHPLTLKEAEKTLPVLPLTVPTKHYSIDQ